MILVGQFDYFQHGEVFLLARDGVQYPRIFPIHSRINPFYSRNFTFITQEITNILLKGGSGWNFDNFGQKSLFHFIE